MEKKDENIILVIEDERPLLLAIKSKLEAEGFETVTARSVEQGINMLKDVPSIGVVWLDHYLLGKKNGLDFIAEVKGSDDWKHIPIFVVTNTGSPEKKTTYLQLGVSEFFTKADYPLMDIITQIKKALKR